MNDIFTPYLKKTVLVFFDDVLMYNKSLEEHIVHFGAIEETQLYAKRSKCFFGQEEVEYLDHIISSVWVATNPNKIEAMVIGQ